MSGFFTQNLINTHILQSSKNIAEAQDVQKKEATTKQNEQIFNQNNTISTENTAPKAKVEKKEINVDDLYDKYKKNPSNIIDDIFASLSDTEKKALKEMIESKKDLKSFLNLIKQDSLNKDDIFEGMKKIKEKKTSGIFSRIGNVVKKVFTDGISEAIDLAKSEKVYYSEKLSETMDEIREVREDFSSRGLADISDKVAQKPEIKETTMHFVKKEEIAGKKLYSEEAVKKATNIIYEKPEESESFLNNAIELESIKDENGNIRYSGDTIVNVDEKMINNKELQPTMMNTAKKSDMTDEFLVGITDNLVKNPKLQRAIDALLRVKDKDGKDRFSAENLHSQSSHLVNKKEEEIINYLNKTIQLSKNDKISSNEIVNIANNDTYSVDTTSEYQSQQNQNFENNTKEQNVFRTNFVTDSIITRNNQENEESGTINNNFNQKNSPNEEKISYTEREIINFLYKKLGSNAEGIYRQIKANPSYAKLLKKYYGNPEVMSTLAKDPQLVTKIVQSSSAITNTQLNQILKECTSPDKTEMMIKLINQFGPQKAITMATHAKKINDNKKVIELLEKTTIDSSQKKEAIENGTNGSLNRNFVA